MHNIRFWSPTEIFSEIIFVIKRYVCSKLLHGSYLTHFTTGPTSCIVNLDFFFRIGSFARESHIPVSSKSDS